MIALITGIAGQDGSYLAEFLLNKGYIVHGIIRRSSSFNTGRINHLINDNTEQGQQDFYVTDSPSNFANIARRFLVNPIQNVKTAPIS